jgi:hypothetical protein
MAYLITGAEAGKENEYEHYQGFAHFIHEKTPLEEKDYSSRKPRLRRQKEDSRSRYNTA